MAQEVELKLVLDAASANAFTGSDLVDRPASTRQMHAVYFDTPDLALSQGGVSLRIRRSGDTLTQTIKVADAKAAGLFARSEWEMEVSGMTPVVDDRTPIPALLGDEAGTVAPIFTVAVERLTWMVDYGEASIELVLDRGYAAAGDRQSPVCELELELKRGEPAALFALAKTIAAHFPVRLGIVTKSERGYALLRPISKACKTERVALSRTASAADAFEAVAGSCIRQYRLNETILLDQADAEALHQARVALRRLRSAFSIFKPLLDGDEVPHFRSELRWLGSVLGEARDLDVLLAKAKPGASLFQDLIRARDAAYAAVDTALSSDRVRALLLDLTEWLVCGAWHTAPSMRDALDAPARQFAAETLHKLRRRVGKRGRSLPTQADEERHEVRKAAKRLRYGAEFFGSLFPGKKRARRYGKFLKSLEKLQDQLGALNDMATAPTVLDRLGLRDEPGARSLLAHRKKSKIIDAAAEAYDDLQDRKTFWG
ncbi:inorganic triphosphatase YgiF [Sphingomonas sp. PP-CE-3G-477]|uniref:CYTH and CHAD domain-containing protein n=1 Tax=Sphingomonas sp. PP-CE-3G-477 TaxID=2135660 RepID=UPI000D39FF72|nr:CHAD domain-containing protein [Sphingomonas sp. PP-CE-3G-477]PTQ60744.1 inorganic triphosphatase YgiF [Sphingomonas sp. PP-CE-3G-477]